jgi:hypothetical protein
VPYDPASIQRQIEDTRAELAETIDAIAEIVSPKRVAERANMQVRAKAVELRAKLLPSDGQHRPELEAAPGAAGGQAPGPGGDVELRWKVRWGRVAVVSGMALVVVVGVNRRRRRGRT